MPGRAAAVSAVTPAPEAGPPRPRPTAPAGKASAVAPPVAPPAGSGRGGPAELGAVHRSYAEIGHQRIGHGRLAEYPGDLRDSTRPGTRCRPRDLQSERLRTGARPAQPPESAARAPSAGAQPARSSTTRIRGAGTACGAAMGRIAGAEEVKGSAARERPRNPPDGVACLPGDGSRYRESRSARGRAPAPD